LETALRQRKEKVAGFIAGKRSLLPKRFERYHFLWACALAPIFIVPPLFALGYSIVLMRRGDSKETNLEWIAIIAAINIVLSAFLLYRAGLYIHDLMGSANGFIDQNVKPWLRFFFDAKPPAPKSSPV